MMNTIRKVIMVVPVLITNCQVSEKWNSGPVTAHTIMMSAAIIKAAGLPVTVVTRVENRLKKRENDFGCSGCIKSGIKFFGKIQIRHYMVFYFFTLPFFK